MNYNIHPIFVHFPIALLFVYSLIKIIPVRKFLPQVNWKDVEIITLLIGVLGAFVALATGDGAEHLFHANRQIVNIHSTFAGIATVLYGVLLAGELASVLNKNFVELINKYSLIKKVLILIEKIFCDKFISVFISILALIAISVTGILGGALVYGASADPIAGIILKMSNINTTNTFNFYCTNGNIAATFSSSTVNLVLSDGRTMTLPQEISGSGIRYGTQSFEFLSKGDNAFVTEDGKNTYENCVSGKVSEVNKYTNKFSNQSNLFNFNYPKIFNISGGELGYTQYWRQNTTTLGTEFVVFSIPKTYQPQTNFGDAKFTVGSSSDLDAVFKCLIGDGYGEKTEQVIINGINYTKLNYSDAGAGNFYDVTSYRTIKDNQCYAIEYTIHSMNIGNYSPDQGIKEFDKIKVQGILEGIVNSFSF